MSIHTIISTLKRLITIHEELCKVSKEKTDIIIEGSVEKLQHLLAKERKYIQLLEQSEIKRQKEVEDWFKDNDFMTEEMTITNMLKILANEVEKKKLENVTVELTNVITQLKQQEQLNQDLIRQSTQLVHMSLEMFNPTINQMNYGKKNNEQTDNRSVFDSQA